jgi:DNA (cytosine-5)-methyltransferase 1
VADSSSEGLQGTEQYETLIGETKASRTITESFKNDGSQWATEPNVGRVADGVPNRVDRLKGLGNAIVPQVIHQIGLAIAKEEGL